MRSHDQPNRRFGLMNHPKRSWWITARKTAPSVGKTKTDQMARQDSAFVGYVKSDQLKNFALEMSAPLEGKPLQRSICRHR